MQIDCTLNAMTVPGFSGIDPPFGTKKPNGQSITGREVYENVNLPFKLQRPFTVSANSTTTQIQANCVFEFVAGGISLTPGAASFNGCRISVINSAAVDSFVVIGSISVAVKSKSVTHFEYVSGGWRVTSDDSEAIGLVTLALDQAGLAGREIRKTVTQRIQSGEVLLKNRGVISGCTVTKSTAAIRNINFAAGVVFLNGMEMNVLALNNAALIQPNYSGQSQTCYAYLFQNTAGEIKFACTPLGGAVPDNGIGLYRITVPSGSNEANAPYLEDVTLTDIRRVEAGYPVQFNSVASVSVALPFTMLDADYSVFIDIVDFKGGGNQRPFVYPGDKAANGFKIYTDGTLDMVRVKWAAVKPGL